MQAVVNHHQRLVKFGAGVLALLFVASVDLSHVGYRFNSTPSLPLGVWKVDPVSGAVRRGQIVSIQPPEDGMFELARCRHYIGCGPCMDGSASLLKRVAAIAGDRVSVSAQGIAVNGAVIPNSKPLTVDSMGRTLAAVTYGTYNVQSGTIWLVSNCARSFDSRYFGSVPSASILGVARPVWIGGFIK
jgi:conjugative transfer signal peptidase TraF